MPSTSYCLFNNDPATQIAVTRLDDKIELPWNPRHRSEIAETLTRWPTLDVIAWTELNKLKRFDLQVLDALSSVNFLQVISNDTT